MGKQCLFFLSFVVLLPLLHGYTAFGAGTDDGSEQWGYVEVRPSMSRQRFIIVNHFVMAAVLFILLK